MNEKENPVLPSRGLPVTGAGAAAAGLDKGETFAVRRLELEGAKGVQRWVREDL